MVRYTATVSLIAVVTGILIMPLAYLSALSGFCMKNPSLVYIATLSLLGDYGLCSYLHLDLIPILLTVLATLHVIVSVRLIVYRVLKENIYYRGIISVLEFSAYVLGFHLIAVAIMIYVL